MRDEEKTYVQDTEVAEAQLSYNRRHDRRMISQFKVTCFCHGNPHVTKEIEVIKWCSLEFFSVSGGEKCQKRHTLITAQASYTPTDTLVEVHLTPVNTE